MQIKIDCLKSICRVCARNNVDLISMSNAETIENSSKIILQCIGVNILEFDGVPSSICKFCSDEIYLFYNFLEKCRESDEKLQTILDKLNLPDLHTDDNGTPYSDDEKEPGSVEKEKRIKHTCEVCGKGLSSASSLRVHQRSHSGELPYSCAACGRRFAQRASLVAHARRHTGQRPFRCSVCSKSFTERTHLRRHASVHSAERPYRCAHCGKGLKSAFALKQHAALHSNRREHMCESCGAAFAAKGNLAAHMRTRHSALSGRCNQCGRSVPDLSQHMVRHTGERAHACQTCGRCFAGLRGLQVHQRRHAAPSFPCSISGCDRSFHTRWVLDCHILKHTGNTPFVCKICSKGFFRSCHLTKHSKVAHPNEC